jgi:hypothetical protein
MNTPINQFEKSFGFDVRRVVERLKKGRIGEHIEKVIMTDDVQTYFTLHLVRFVEGLANEMTPEARPEFLKLVTADLLWQNFSVNMAMNAFVNGLRKWLRAEDENFDDIIIDFVTIENAKRVIDALKGSYKSISTEVQARYISIEWPDISGGGQKGPKFYS